MFILIGEIDLSSTVALFRSARQLGPPVLICCTEGGYHIPDLGIVLRDVS